MSNLPELLTINEAADMLCLSKESIQKYIKAGDIKAYKISGIKLVRIDKKALIGKLEAARKQYA